MGSDPAAREKLFGKFVCLTRPRAPGSLYLSKGIVEAHGGTIRGENNASGRGATFSFTLPVN